MAKVNTRARDAEAVAAKKAEEKAEADKVKRAEIADEKKGLAKCRFQAGALTDLAWAGIERVLRDPDAPGATVIKASQVVFERAYGKVQDFVDDVEKDKGNTTTLRLISTPKE